LCGAVIASNFSVTRIDCAEDIVFYQLVNIILETAVGRAKAVQVIDVHGGFKKFVVTLLVMRTFLNLSGASITCADLRDPTAVSRIMLSQHFFIF
jgi:hypothetical protein